MHKVFWSFPVTNKFRFALFPLFGGIALLVAAPVLAATSGGEEINWPRMAMELFGGLALFLFGMEQIVPIRLTPTPTTSRVGIKRIGGGCGRSRPR